MSASNFGQQLVTEPLLAIRNLEHRVHGRPGQESFRFQAEEIAIYRRDFVAILGETGTGKSTLLWILALVQPPTYANRFVARLPNSHGLDTELDVLDLWENRPRHLRTLVRQHFGLSFQQAELLDSLTVKENVELPLSLVGTPEKKLRVDELLHSFSRGTDPMNADLVHIGDSRPHEISGGQAQRTALAMAIAHKPVLAFFDEPTSNLDPETALNAFAVLDEHRRRFGMTIIAVTHDHELARRFATRILRTGVIAPGVGAVLRIETPAQTAITRDLPSLRGYPLF